MAVSTWSHTAKHWFLIPNSFVNNSCQRSSNLCIQYYLRKMLLVLQAPQNFYRNDSILWTLRLISLFNVYTVIRGKCAALNLSQSNSIISWEGVCTSSCSTGSNSFLCNCKMKSYVLYICWNCRWCGGIPLSVRYLSFIYFVHLQTLWIRWTTPSICFSCLPMSGSLRITFQST